MLKVTIHWYAFQILTHAVGVRVRGVHLEFCQETIPLGFEFPKGAVHALGCKNAAESVKSLSFLMI